MHIPVLLNEAIEALQIKADGIYVDLTLGACGHSQEILKRLSAKGRLIGFDKDEVAINIAKNLGDERLIICHCGFAQLNDKLAELGKSGILGESFSQTPQVDGILVDLGVSSMQIDDGKRGFSFMKDGPLDMRMDIRQELTAKEWINNVDEQTLQEVIKYEGEERNARKIAKAIIKNRDSGELLTTHSLCKIVRSCVAASKNWRATAARTFQAVRIHINSEAAELSSLLSQIPSALNIGGRFVAISFHSLESRTIKNFINADLIARQKIIACLPKGMPIDDSSESQIRNNSNRMFQIGRAISPGKEELLINPRASSAFMRVAKKY